MTTPALDHPWQCAVDVPLSDYSTSALATKSALMNLKNMLTGVVGGITEGLMTLTQSCDSVSVSASDLWTDNTKIVRATAGVAHSWAVLRNTSSAFWMILHISGTTDYQALNLTYTYEVPTGGTATARPTATHEIVMAANQQLVANEALPVRCNLALSSQGQFYFHTKKNGEAFSRSHLFAFLPVSGPAGNTYPWIFGAYYGVSRSSTASWTTTILKWYKYDSSGMGTGLNIAYPLAGSSYAYSATNIPSGGDAIDGTFPMSAVPVLHTASPYCNLGRLSDIYWGPSVLVEGTPQPLSPASPVFCMVGDLWLPFSTVWT